MFLEAHNPMKHRWLFVAVVVIFLACSILLQGAGSAAPYADNADAKIRAVLEEQREAWNRADIESFMKGYWHSADLTFSGTSGVTRGWEPVMQRYRERYRDAQAMGHLDFTDIEVHRLGQDAAFVLGRWNWVECLRWCSSAFQRAGRSCTTTQVSMTKNREALSEGRYKISRISS
jgi:ketosteroid isomerase-like protein